MSAPASATQNTPRFSRQTALLILLILVAAIGGYVMGRELERQSAYNSYIELLLGATLEQRGDSVVLREINPLGPAYNAGIREGDRLDRIDSERIENAREARRILRQFDPGDQVLLTIDHNPIIDQYTLMLGFTYPYPIPIEPPIIILPDPVSYLEPHLGIYFRAVSASDNLGSSEGALVITVSSPAADAGVEVGDIITAVNGERVTSSNPLDYVLSRFSVGERVRLTINRSGNSRTISVTLAP